MLRRAYLAALACLPLLLPPAAARAKDDLIIGVAQFPSSLNPFIDPEVVKQYAIDFATRPLTSFDKDWKLVCLLCTELPTVANGGATLEDRPDGTRGMAVRFTLKPGLAWGDGKPVTSDDVAFTWKVGRDPKAGVADPHAWANVEQVEIVDPRSFVLHLKTPDTEYNQWGAILPAHVESAAYEGAANPGDYGKLSAYNRAPTTAGLYNGPYIVTGYTSGAQIVFEPNPHWPGHKPALSRIVIRAIENTAALQANLLSGDIDMVGGEGVGLTIDQVLGLQKQYPDRFQYLFRPSLSYEHIDLQRDNPILADLRVRKALLLAIDRKTVNDRLFGGKQPVAATWVNPLEANYSTDVPQYAYDPAQAKALLAEAGWTPGPDGICRNDKGERLSLVFQTTAGNRLRELVQQVLQSQWKSACVEATIKNEPARTLFGETLKRRTYSGMVMYAWSSAVGASPRPTLATASIPTAANGFSGSNMVAFSDPTMDADIERAARELDPAKQKAIWAEMQRIYAEQLRVLPLYFRSEAHVIPPWLQGYEPTGHSGYVSLWAEYWHPG